MGNGILATHRVVVNMQGDYMTASIGPTGGPVAPRTSIVSLTPTAISPSETPRLSKKDVTAIRKAFGNAADEVATAARLVTVPYSNKQAGHSLNEKTLEAVSYLNRSRDRLKTVLETGVLGAEATEHIRSILNDLEELTTTTRGLYRTDVEQNYNYRNDEPSLVHSISSQSAKLRAMEKLRRPQESIRRGS